MKKKMFLENQKNQESYVSRSWKTKTQGNLD